MRSCLGEDGLAGAGICGADRGMCGWNRGVVRPGYVLGEVRSERGRTAVTFVGSGNQA